MRWNLHPRPFGPPTWTQKAIEEGARGLRSLETERVRAEAELCQLEHEQAAR